MREAPVLFRHLVDMLFGALALALLFAATWAAWRGKDRCVEMRACTEGREVRVRAYRPRHRWDVPSVSVRVRLRHELPDGLVVDVPELGRVAVERGQLQVETSELRRYPRWLARWKLQGTGLQGRWLTLAQDAGIDQTRRLSRLAARAASALEHAAAGTWPEEARRLGLTFEDRHLRGELEGLWVHIGRAGPDTLIQVSAPKDFRAIGGRGRTGNPVQDMFVKATRALPAEHTAALLAVVHGHPGSTVEGGAVRLRLSGQPRDLEPGLRAALDLAHVLRAECAALRAQ